MVLEQEKIIDLVSKLTDGVETLNSEELNSLISTLKTQKKITVQKEREEQEHQEKLAEEERIRQEEKAAKEHIQKVTSMTLDMSWENLYQEDMRAEDIHADNASDGLIFSLTNLGKVDIEYIAQITGLTLQEIIVALKGSIYQNPNTWDEVFYKGWETAEEYLSGNVYAKWKAAKAANDKYEGYFEANVKALEEVFPMPLTTEDIYVTLGSPWVPTDIVEDFVVHMLGESSEKIGVYKNGTYSYVPRRCEVLHDMITGSWEIKNKALYKHKVLSDYTFGTKDVPALEVLERTLNMKTLEVYAETVEEAKKAGHPRQIHKEKTTQAINMQKKQIKEFQNWVWKDEKRTERLQKIYEETYGGRRGRHFDGSFLTFPGMNPDITLYPYQKNAAARIMFSPNTLLAHDVGSGKTYVMIAAGMEMKRMGISKKNLYVVPNNILSQWEGIYRNLYPQAKILVIGPKAFTTKKRKQVLERIRDEEFDGIIMAYSCFDMISVSAKTDIELLKKEREAVEQEFNSQRGHTKQLRAKLEQLDKKIKKLEENVSTKTDLLPLEDLGITRLFLDEAHNYKNVTVHTKANKVMGLSTGGSAKCDEMMTKVKMIQKQNDGKGIIMATGTPITNSITEAYVFQRYLQSGTLDLLDLQNFDSWIGMFAERVTEFEIDVDTSNFRMATRFAKFHNLPELTTMLSEIADFHHVDCSEKGLPDFTGYDDKMVEKTKSFEDYLKEISIRADRIRHGGVSRKDDNMLLLTTDGRKAALDLRLVEPNEPFSCECKAYQLAEQVYEIYKSTTAMKGTQLIFCDISTPKEGFNLYDEVKKFLLDLGVPEEEIAYIYDATTDGAREILFEDVRRGEVRILMGSTFKLGLGVNVQDRLAAIHHLDVPWRPADMVQREGRILRQGNQNKEVHIYRYITKGSFDAYSWQLLETKQRFIADLLSGTLEDRNGSDVDDTVLNYAEVKALAIGNDLIKKRVELQNELQKTQILFHEYEQNRTKLEAELSVLPDRIEKLEIDKSRFSISMRYFKGWNRENKTLFELGDKNYKQCVIERKKELASNIHKVLKDRMMYGYTGKHSSLLNYEGLLIDIPQHVNPEDIYVWIRCYPDDYKHKVKLGENVDGYMRRIQYYVDHMEEYFDKMCEEHSKLLERLEQIQMELSNSVNYQDDIASLKRMLNAVDKELGVKNNE